MLAAVLFACSAFSACANNEQVAFYPYWQKDVSLTQHSLHEELVYDVTFTPETSSTGRNYTLQYKDGSYTTSLTLVAEGQSLYYVYRSELNITAEYTYQQETKSCVDHIVSEVKCKADSTLLPVYSKKSIKSSSPRNAEVTSVDQCFNTYEYEIVTDYNATCSSGTSIVTPKDEESVTKKFSIDKSKYNYIDNEQLLFAVRGLDPTANNTPTIQAYAPFVRQVQLLDVQFNTVKGADFTFALNGVSDTRTVQYYPVSIKINGQYPGATQVAWVASQKTASFRNVILKLETPLAYNLGTLTYTLASATFSD